ncbi:Iron-regulated ABC transporter permease protein SufD [Pedobacter westerhofensis]|uniref:Iron-regulated ABC transporter permease protein SufD n=1 Tax=Pedobacter westerhofensis TaxID=425512 RepID=A0A521F2H6_9SPHI|nr:Fe-S cluster assembly protein SufD [Pedobacter westerhofensis]SMO90375.1 Iron-regulated ABC transporter permease protein SufD [Pedobacter westerhofensis]
MLLEKTKLLDQYFDEVLKEQQQIDLLLGDPVHPNLYSLRDMARQSFRSKGIPHSGMEDWKYTPVRAFVEKILRVKDGYPKYSSSAADALQLEKSCYIMVIIDGKWWPHLSDPILTDSLEIASLDQVSSETAKIAHLGAHADIEHPFAALNTALFSDGIMIRVKTGVLLEKPIYLVHISMGEINPMFYPRMLFVAEKHTKVTLIEKFVVSDTSIYTVNNSVSEVVVENGAEMEHYYIHTENELSVNLQYARVILDEGSKYSNYNFALPGSPFIRHDLHVSMRGTGAETTLYGMVLTSKKQLVDNHTCVDHSVPDCISNEHYKCIVKDQSTLVFNGKVIVHPDAQRTNSFQKNSNLLLSDDAVINTKPELEIYADDVKCSHGATMGQFDSEALFYLTSRGIRENTARQMLMEAFAAEIIEVVPDEMVKQYLKNIMAEHL